MYLFLYLPIYLSIHLSVSAFFIAHFEKLLHYSYPFGCGSSFSSSSSTPEAFTLKPAIIAPTFTILFFQFTSLWKDFFFNFPSINRLPSQPVIVIKINCRSNKMTEKVSNAKKKKIRQGRYIKRKQKVDYKKKN